MHTTDLELCFGGRVTLNFFGDKLVLLIESFSRSFLENVSKNTLFSTTVGFIGIALCAIAKLFGLLNVVYLILSATIFLLGSILLGKFFNKTFVAVADKLQTRGQLVIPALTFAFFMAFVANAIHLEAILGAFAAGLVLDETDKRKELDKQVVPIADILVPIFFVTVGARADLGVLNPRNADNRTGLIIAAFLIVV